MVLAVVQHHIQVHELPGSFGPIYEHELVTSIIKNNHIQMCKSGILGLQMQYH